MTLVLKDRVRETSTTGGTGTLTLSGAVTGFQTFSTAIGNGNTCYYVISRTGDSEWETGLGTVGAGTLSRDTVISSSNSGSLVSLSGSTKDVYVALPSSKTPFFDASGVLNAGSIGSGFGAIDVGADSISGGTLTGNLLVGGSGLYSAQGSLSPSAGVATTMFTLSDGDVVEFAVFGRSGAGIIVYGFIACNASNKDHNEIWRSGGNQPSFSFSGLDFQITAILALSYTWAYRRLYSL